MYPLTKCDNWVRVRTLESRGGMAINIYLCYFVSLTIKRNWVIKMIWLIVNSHDLVIGWSKRFSRLIRIMIRINTVLFVLIGIKGKILSIKRNQNSSTLLFNVSHVLKCSRCGFYAGQVKIKSRTTCPCFKEKECTRLKKGKTYVVLGYRNGNNGLRLKWAWAWPENRHRLSVLKWRRSGRKNSGSD